MPADLIIGIDASRNRSGGAKAHLVGILSEGEPTEFGIREVHVWAYPSLLAAIPERSWLIKHSPPALSQNLLKQLWWQYFQLHKELIQVNCDILLNTSASTVSSYSPAVTMSRDMLAYETGESERLGWTFSRLRQVILRVLQNRSLTQSQGAIFLTRYAAKVIQSVAGPAKSVAHIPHGVGVNFKQQESIHAPDFEITDRINCLYVSPVWEFKHQWVVVEATAELRQRGYDIRLDLVGGAKKRPQQWLEDQLGKSDPSGDFVTLRGQIPQDELPGIISAADIFVFASSCENMPNTLLEGMAIGLPIASSERGPMPEILEDGGVYFDPEDHISIADSIEALIKDKGLRKKKALRAKELAEAYSWKRCASETFSFLVETHAAVSQES